MNQSSLNAVSSCCEVKKANIYRPLILIAAYLVGAVVLSALKNGSFALMSLMGLFMGLFFVVFSFFKLLDPKGFAESYASYDVIARRWPGYGYVYPFIELALGALYLFESMPRFTNVATLVVMSVSSVGVIQSLARKQKIKCACLGTVFDLPMSTVTLVEDLLMVAMSLAMLTLA